MVTRSENEAQLRMGWQVSVQQLDRVIGYIEAGLTSSITHWA
jgi:hypothetical protein